VTKHGYDDGPEELYEGPPEDTDDWGAEDWEHFWVEPQDVAMEDDLQTRDEEYVDVLPADSGMPDPSPSMSPGSSPPDPKWRPRDVAPRAIRKDPSAVALVQSAEAEFVRSPDAWLAVKVAKAWREAGAPNDAIRFAVRARAALRDRGPMRARAALLTTVGASYEDIGRRSVAWDVARQAIKLYPEAWHPYRLAGRLAAGDGSHARADELFAKANELERLANERKSWNTRH